MNARTRCSSSLVLLLLAAMSGCVKTQPHELAEGETAEYKGGRVVPATGVRARSNDNTDWITAIRVVEPSPGNDSFRPDQPIPCVFELEMADETSDYTTLMAEIRRGRVVFGTRRPHTVSRVQKLVYRYQTTFEAGLRKPGEYQIRAVAARAELPADAAASRGEPIVRRSYSSPVKIEVRR